MTSLDQFLQETPAVAPEASTSEKPPATESVSVAQTAATTEAVAPSDDVAGSESVHAPGASQESAPEGEPEGMTALTPSGIEVYYQWAPKRLYRVRKALAYFPDKGETGAWSDWVEVPSVTTVLGCLDKAGLPWWGMKSGVEGFLELHERGLIREMSGAFGKTALCVPGKGMTGSSMSPATVENVVGLLTEFKLTVNHKRDKAGDRGQSVHDAFESWANNDVWPQPDIYPETERGYVRGLIRFLEDAAIEPGGTEIMVGSIEHDYAGRYDLRAIMADSDLVTKTYPRRVDKVETIEGGSFILDLKTSSGVYPTHFMQLEAYEAASVECGYTPTQGRAVIHVTADGKYEFVRSKATIDDFLAVKSAYDALESMKRRRK